MNQTKRVSTPLELHNFQYIAAKDFYAPAELDSARDEFFNEWNNLGEDKYLPNNAKYRKRRYGLIRYNSALETIELLPHSSFLQSEELNSAAGGIKRVFAPLTDQIFNNAFLRHLVKANIAKFSLTDDMQGKSWEINVHLMRIIGTAEEIGDPTPEGMHSDGVDFIAMHLINGQNYLGGESLIYNGNRELVFQRRLSAPMDSIYVNDRKMFHAASRVEPSNPKEPGIRDLLTLDCVML